METIRRLKVQQGFSADEKLNEKTPVVEQINVIINNAKNLNASDIHIETTRENCIVRYRVNGDLRKVQTIQKFIKNQFITELKRICKFNISSIDTLQDSSVEFKTLQLTIRGSLIPSLYGENIVLRLINQEHQPCLSDIIRKEQEDLSKQVLNKLKRKSGVILLSGATGSGKSTTVYGMLKELDKKIKKVVSIENPVEKRVAGVSQFEVTKKMEFKTILKGVLRHDPDIIFIGEIRDEVSAEIAFQSANTGHLVISTIHANNPSSVVPRLKGLGISEDIVDDSLLLVMSQRLEKLLCACKQIGGQSSEGCKKCHEGVIGRTALFDYLTQEQILAGERYKKFDDTELRSKGIIL